VKWTEYPTRRHRQAREDGTQLEGQPVSPAPGGGEWAVTADKRFHQVKTRNGVSWCIAEDDPQ
jgi:hypothetical protein